MHSIILHLYYQDLWPEFKSNISNILNENTHLYVTVIDDKTDYIDDIKRLATDVFLVENRGLDVAPFIFVYNKIKDFGYKTFLKLHTKKSLHTPNIGDYWRQSLYQPIVENYNYILEQIKDINTPLILGSEKYYCQEDNSSPNKIAEKQFIDIACKYLNVQDGNNFFAGTMFLVNDVYLNNLFNNIDLIELYNKFEIGYCRGSSLAHAMERIFGYGIKHYNGTYILI